MKTYAEEFDALRTEYLYGDDAAANALYLSCRTRGMRGVATPGTQEFWARIAEIANRLAVAATPVCKPRSCGKCGNIISGGPCQTCADKPFG